MKTTPAQNRVLRQLRERPIHGVPLGDLRGVAVSRTLEALQRRGLAVVMTGRVYAR